MRIGRIVSSVVGGVVDGRRRVLESPGEAAPGGHIQKKNRMQS
jgi:hypothetical protein